jgi:hypothetical protein
MSFLADEVIERIADRVQKGVPLQTALKAAGVTDAMVREWERIANGSVADEEGLRERIVAFTGRIGQAQAECESLLVEGIAETSATIGKSGLPEWRAGAWLLNNHPRYRDTYRQQRELKITSTPEPTLEQKLVAEASLEQLEAWAALELQSPEAG